MNTLNSLKLVQKISEEISNNTFHHHYYILFDIANTFSGPIKYLEIGCYAGGSSCLMLQRPNTEVHSIDLGKPISKQTVLDNVKKLNYLGNKYFYHEGNSRSDVIKSEVSGIEYEMLFIDGDHSYNGVKLDFNAYSKLVKSGGYIIFDDYNDAKYSPDVNRSVNDIVSGLDKREYEIIGTFENKFNARPSELKDGNCFVIKKK